MSIYDLKDARRYLIKRTEGLRELLRKNSLNNLVVFKDENIFYLTGFYGTGSKSVLLVTENKIFLLVNFIYLEEASGPVRNPDIEIIEYGSGQRHSKLAEITGNFNFQTINIEGNSLSLKEYRKFEESVKKAGMSLSVTDDMIETLRIQKDIMETGLVEKSCMVADRVFDHILGLDSGMLKKTGELFLSIELELKMVKEGADGKSFETVIASGKNTSKPHYSPGHGNIGEGVMLVDFGCRFRNYCSDMTRTFFIGRIKNSGKFREIYDIVLQAQLAAIDACREGRTCNEVDRAARKIIESQGYGQYFGHGTGHGVGLEIHERPYLAPGNNEMLRQGMVVTIEPGIYVRGFGGVRIEDMVLVGKNSCRVLYKSPKNLIILK